jgi:hypothetical protein
MVRERDDGSRRREPAPLKQYFNDREFPFNFALKTSPFRANAPICGLSGRSLSGKHPWKGQGCCPNFWIDLT